MMSTNQGVWLHAIQTAVPPTSYPQELALDFMKGLPLYGDKERAFLDRIYQGTMIDRRHSVIEDYGKPVEQYQFFAADESLLPEPTVSARNDLFVTWANRLSAEAVSGLLTALPELDRSTITHLITVSCTGFSAPGFDYHLVTTLGLSDRIHRYHIGFMGCYAGFPAMKLAHTICSADPSARVLIADVELCTLHFQFKPEQDTMVANALFADGAAAALVSAEPPVTGRTALRLDRFFSRILAESDSAMTWRLGDIAFDMRLSAYVPRLIKRDIAAIVRDTMAEEPTTGDATGDTAWWAIHPGGRAILDRVATALDLQPNALEDSFAVLRDYGNMSSATIFFVLKRMLERQAEGSVFAVAFGPGLTIESARMTLARG